MTKLIQPEFTKILEEASQEAYYAANSYIETYPESWFPCGFAWVNIKPARGPLVSFLKKNRIGRTDDYYGGYTIYNPSGHSTQCMEAKRLGCVAYIQKLKQYFPDLQISYSTRID